MIHLGFGLISLFLWVIGISAISFAAFMTFEIVQHRKTYLLDGWSEEALLEERIASGTLLPAVPTSGTLTTAMHIVMKQQTEASTQQDLASREASAENIPLEQPAAARRAS